MFIDAALSWNLLKVGGIIAFDDYEWNCGETEADRPRIAIDAFESCFAGRIQRLAKGWRVFYRKLAA